MRAEALTAARAFSDDNRRGEALAALSLHLPEGPQTDAMWEIALVRADIAAVRAEITWLEAEITRVRLRRSGFRDQSP
jgi:hypothetical protein